MNRALVIGIRSGIRKEHKEQNMNRFLSWLGQHVCTHPTGKLIRHLSNRNDMGVPDPYIQCTGCMKMWPISEALYKNDSAFRSVLNRSEP